jgi:hypothetical protein
MFSFHSNWLGRGSTPAPRRRFIRLRSLTAATKAHTAPARP